MWRVHAAGWRVRYEPAAAVRHDHRTDLLPWLRRKAYYGTGAAPLAARHGSDVAPLVLTPWTTALTVAVLAQRRWSLPVAALVGLGVTVSIGRKVHDEERPVRTAASLTALGAVSALRQAGPRSPGTTGRWPCSPPPGPAAPAAPCWSPPSPTGCSTTVGCSPTSTRSRFTLARRLDDLAYGTGLWAGAVRARDPRSLVPAFRGFRPRRGT